MQEVQHPLITPDEVMRRPAARKDAHGQILEPGHRLIFIAGQAPIYGRQILYFRDPRVPAAGAGRRTGHQ